MTDLKKIKHVEDDPSIQMVARVALETVGHFGVCTCNGGVQAPEQSTVFLPQLILLAVMMPRHGRPKHAQARSSNCHNSLT